MKAAEFLTDLEAKPAMLHALADTLGAASESEVWPIARGDRLLLAGMGSSWFAMGSGTLRGAGALPFDCTSLRAREGSPHSMRKGALSACARLP